MFSGSFVVAEGICWHDLLLSAKLDRVHEWSYTLSNLEVGTKNVLLEDFDSLWQTTQLGGRFARLLSPHQLATGCQKRRTGFHTITSCHKRCRRYYHLSKWRSSLCSLDVTDNAVVYPTPKVVATASHPDRACIAGRSYTMLLALISTQLRWYTGNSTKMTDWSEYCVKKHRSKTKISVPTASATTRASGSDPSDTTC